VDVLKVREIIRMPTITRMPNSPEYIEGIINLRGKVIPIISMRRRFNEMEADDTGSTRIIIMDVAGSLTGFIVDSVSEVIRSCTTEVVQQTSQGAHDSATSAAQLNGNAEELQRLVRQFKL
jgi:purine-binding chemotaxis protein CheW